MGFLLFFSPKDKFNDESVKNESVGTGGGPSSLFRVNKNLLHYHCLEEINRCYHCESYMPALRKFCRQQFLLRRVMYGIQNVVLWRNFRIHLRQIKRLNDVLLLSLCAKLAFKIIHLGAVTSTKNVTKFYSKPISCLGTG